MQTIPTQAKQSEEEQEMCGDYSEGGYCDREDDGMGEESKWWLDQRTPEFERNASLKGGKRGVYESISLLLNGRIDHLIPVRNIIPAYLVLR